MKLLSFHYHLRISLDAPVQKHCFTLRCLPQSDARQRIRSLQHYVFPADFLSESRDHWGNGLLYGCCREAHSAFEANVCGEAVTGLADAVPGRSPVQERIFRIPTRLTMPDARIAALSAGLPGGSILAQAEAAMLAVHKALNYVPGATDVSTSAAAALALGCGVCQDYAHILLAVLRSREIPCRYVTGMLLGEGKSHAWVEVFAGSRWYALDPTNCTAVDDAHISLSHGRDAADCPINRGIFRGIARQSTEISVIVTEVH